MIQTLYSYCNFGNFHKGFSFLKIKPSRCHGKINLSFTDVAKPGPSREFLTLQMYLLTLFANNKILGKISEFTVNDGIFSFKNA